MKEEKKAERIFRSETGNYFKITEPVAIPGTRVRVLNKTGSLLYIGKIK